MKKLTLLLTAILFCSHNSCSGADSSDSEEEIKKVDPFKEKIKNREKHERFMSKAYRRWRKLPTETRDFVVHQIVDSPSMAKMSQDPDAFLSLAELTLHGLRAYQDETDRNAFKTLVYSRAIGKIISQDPQPEYQKASGVILFRLPDFIVANPNIPDAMFIRVAENLVTPTAEKSQTTHKEVTERFITLTGKKVSAELSDQQ